MTASRRMRPAGDTSSGPYGTPPPKQRRVDRRPTSGSRYVARRDYCLP